MFVWDKKVLSSDYLNNNTLWKQASILTPTALFEVSFKTVFCTRLVVT